MTVGELISKLEEYGTHLEVIVSRQPENSETEYFYQDIWLTECSNTEVMPNEMGVQINIDSVKVLK